VIKLSPPLKRDAPAISMLTAAWIHYVGESSGAFPGIVAQFSRENIFLPLA
jgi:hypothetical protein